MMMSDFSFHFWPFWPVVITFFSLLFLFDLFLRAVALWRAARANQIWWFIAVLIFNTAGILPLVYLLFFAQEKLFTDEVGQKSKQRSKTSPTTRKSKKQ
jgi:hypothetical protein